MGHRFTTFTVVSLLLSSCVAEYYYFNIRGDNSVAITLQISSDCASIMLYMYSELSVHMPTSIGRTFIAFALQLNELCATKSKKLCFDHSGTVTL